MTAAYALLAFYADLLDDLEGQRKRLDNQVRALTDSPEDHDGKFGKGLVLPELDQKVVAGLRDHIALAEGITVLQLKRATRQLPFHAFITETRGIAEKGVGRLLGAIGDPSWNPLHDRPRTVRELWAYCGFHVVDGMAPKRRKGQTANWSTRGKTAAFLLAEAQMKTRGAYRHLYDAEKARQRPLVESDGHAHNRALRVVSKEILRDLWRVSNGQQPLHGSRAGRPAFGERGAA